MLFEIVFKFTENVFVICEIDFMVHNSNHGCQFKNCSGVVSLTCQAAFRAAAHSTDGDQNKMKSIPTPVKNVLIVGGGTAGWLTAAFLARTLGAGADENSVLITLVESKEIGIIGVGEGTFPSIRGTLAAIGIDEARFVSECNATFKQGVKFVDWVRPRGASQPGREHYFHPFSMPSQRAGGPELLPYWLQGAAGDAPFAAVATMQKRVADASHAPKRGGEADFMGAFNYAYHFDAVRFAALLCTHAQSLGVRRVQATVERVDLAADGAIAAVVTGDGATLTADLY